MRAFGPATVRRLACIVRAHMRESRLGFSYSWADLHPVRALAVTVVAAQAIGAAIGWAVGNHDKLILSLWFGAAIATFPAFLLGLLIQSRIRAGSLSENRVMVRRLGFVALVLSVAALGWVALRWF